MVDEEQPLWHWTETAEFAGYCYAILPDADVSDVDLLRDAIRETVVFDPTEAPVLRPKGHARYDAAIRRFTVLDSAHWAFPPTIVVFRIDNDPDETLGILGEVTGLAAWDLSTLRRVGGAPY